MSAQIEIREYQVRIIDNVIKAIAGGHRHILIEAPTGSGKTCVAHLIAQRLHQIYGYNAGWCAMRKHLLHQARAENAEKIGFEHIRYFSMFDKSPPNADVLIDDECLPGSTRLLVIHNNTVILTTLLDVMGGVGTHTLSVDSNGYIFQPIVSRVDMGVRKLLELNTIDTTLLITNNGRVFADGEFVRADSITKNAVCCQTYNSTQRTTYGNGIKTAILEAMPNQPADQENGACPTLRVRVWPKGLVEFKKMLLQQILVQSSPETSQG